MNRHKGILFLDILQALMYIVATVMMVSSVLSLVVALSLDPWIYGFEGKLGYARAGAYGILVSDIVYGVILQTVTKWCFFSRKTCRFVPVFSIFEDEDSPISQ